MYFDLIVLVFDFFVGGSQDGVLNNSINAR